MDSFHHDPASFLSANKPSSEKAKVDSTNTNLWRDISPLLKSRVGSEFERWFDGAELYYDTGIALLSVSGPMQQLWIEMNHVGLIRELLMERLGVPVELSIAVQPQAPKQIYNVKPTTGMVPTAAAARGTLHVKTESKTVAEPNVQTSLADANLSPKFSFDNFVIGTTNTYCAAVAKAVAEKPGRIYNPLFFHGNPGLGKTHLLHAIGREVLYRKKKTIVRYLSTEAFTNEFVESIRKQTLSQFRNKYRKVDVLLLDDVQFLGGKDSTQEEFFHTFNDLFNNTKQIVLASDRPAADIPYLEKRLVSRFEWGLSTQIQAPDFETRMAILKRKMSDYDVDMDEWVLEFISNHIRSDIRKLEGAVMRAAAHHSLHDGTLTEKTLEEMLRDIMDHEPGRTVSTDRIQRIVAEVYDIRMAEMVGRGRPKMIAEARQVAMYFTRELAKLSLVEVGKAFGGRDHGTVIHAIKVINDRMKTVPEFVTRMNEIQARIQGSS
jgi:chromosomal replication initiator protein